MTKFVFGSFGNTIACWYIFFAKNNNNTSIKISRGQKSQTRKASQDNALKILASLLVADSLVCFLCLPLQAFRMFRYQWTLHCNLEAVAFYLTITTVWTSSMTICFIAFDRVILLTKYQYYTSIMNKKTIKVFMVVCWTISAFGPASKFIPGGGGNKLFAPLNALNLLLPVIVLPVSCYRVVKTFKQSQSQVTSYENKQRPPNHLNQIAEGMENSTEETKCQTVFSTKPTISTMPTPTTTTSVIAQINTKSVEKVSKRCLLLISNFFCCTIIATSFMVLLIANEKFHFLSNNAEDLLTRFSFLGLTINSCINPVVYVMRDRNFKKTLMNAFCIMERKNQQSKPSRSTFS